MKKILASLVGLCLLASPALAGSVNDGAIKLLDDDLSNYILFDTPSAVTSNRTCTLLDAAAMIPASCVAGVKDADFGDISVSSGVWSLDADVVDAAEIAADAVGSSEIAANAVGISEMADDAVGINELDLTDETTPADGECIKYTTGGTNGSLTTGTCGSGGGLSDADYGDITVSGTGTVMNIDAGAVGSAEIATDAVGTDELDAAAVESELEAVLDLADLQGNLTGTRNISIAGTITTTGANSITAGDDLIATDDLTVGDAITANTLTLDGGGVDVNTLSVAPSGLSGQTAVQIDVPSGSGRKGFNVRNIGDSISWASFEWPQSDLARFCFGPGGSSGRDTCMGRKSANTFEINTGTSGTLGALIVGTIELGAQSDTTLARSGAGDVTIEGNAIVRSGTSAGGDLTGTYPNPTVAANSVALGTDTTGGYAASASEGGPADSVKDADFGDISISSGVWSVDANSVALGTDTTGNYMSDVSAGTGVATTHTPAEGSTATIALDYSDAGASPALSADQCRFTSNATVAGYIVCEGDTADANETRIKVTDPTADRTFTIPDADSVAVQPQTCTGSDKISGIAADGTISCNVDAGGGGATLADGDYGDIVVSGTGTIMTVDTNSVALGTDTTGNYAGSSSEGGSATSAVAVDDADKGDISISSGVWSVDADSIALGTDTTGNYVASLVAGTAIDVGSAAEGGTPTIDWDSTEVNSVTWGAGSFTTMTFDAGATDPVWTYGSGTTALTSSKFYLNSTTDVLQSVNLGTASPEMQITATDQSASFGITRFVTTDVNVPRIFISKSNDGSIGSYTAMDATDDIGDLVFEGSDGSKLVRAGAVRASMDGTPGTDDMPGRLIFSTTADGASTPTDRWIVDSAGMFKAGADNSYDIGTQSNAVRTVNVDTSIELGGTASTLTASGGVLSVEGNAVVASGTSAGGDLTGTYPNPTVAADSVALGTDTTGNYAAGDAEGGAALTGDSATAFFSTGTLEDARVDGSLEVDEVLNSDLGDFTCTAGSCAIDANAVALGTDTTGNYVADVAAGLGLAVTGSAGEGWTPTLALSFADAGASPALSADQCEFTSNATVAGFLVCEGDTADTSESRIAVTDPTGDRTFTLPDADSYPVTDKDYGDITVSASGQTWAVNANSVALGTDTTGNYAGSSSEGGSATSAVAVDDADKGDISISSGVWSVDANSVALGTDTTGGYAASASEGGPADSVKDADFGDISISSGVWSVDADSVALGTDTTGNYVATITAGTGISGSSSSEGGTPTIGLDYSDAGASPSLNADECRFTSNATVAGYIVCEGDTADANESRIKFTDPTADRTFTIPDADSNAVQPLTCSGTDKVSAISSAGVVTCSADTGGGGLADGDYGDITVGGSGTTLTVDADSIALGTDTTGNYVASLTAGNGIDVGAAAEGATPTIDVDLTEISAAVFGDGTTSSVQTGTIELGAATDTTIARSAAGTVTIEGKVVETAGIKDLWIPAGAVMPAASNGCAQGTFASSTSAIQHVVCDFDPTTAESGYFPVAFPKSADETVDLTAEVYWTSTGSGGVVWSLACTGFSDDDVMTTAFSAADQVADTVTAANDLMVSGAITAITVQNWAENDLVFCKIARVPGDASDTSTSDARLEGVKIHYTTNAANDN